MKFADIAAVAVIVFIFAIGLASIILYSISLACQ